MDFKQLRTFQTAALTLNFSEAAEMLGYVQSAVTAQIRALESDLNTRLFDRNGRGVRLTDAGQQLLTYAEKLFALRDEAELAVKQTKAVHGAITIAGYETVLTYRLPKILDEYVKTYPEVRVNIVPLSVRQLKSQVLNAQIDIAFTMEQGIQISGLEQECLRGEKVVVIASADHRLAKQKNVTASDLKDENILFTEPGCSYRALFERALVKGGVLDRPKLEFISIEPIKACVKLGMGVAAVSEISAAKELASGELVALDWCDDSLDVGLHMVWNSRRWMSPAIRAFMELTESMYAD